METEKESARVKRCEQEEEEETYEALASLTLTLCLSRSSLSRRLCSVNLLSFNSLFVPAQVNPARVREEAEDASRVVFWLKQQWKEGSGAQDGRE